MPAGIKFGARLINPIFRERSAATSMKEIITKNRSLLEETEKLLNDQIKLEGVSSAFYRSMASWAEIKGFENSAAFLYDHLFIRTDILVKKGNYIKLIEVKSKSFNSEDPNTFIGKKGGLVSAWKPYLFDVAFQNHVIQKCYLFCTSFI